MKKNCLKIFVFCMAFLACLLTVSCGSTTSPAEGFRMYAETYGYNGETGMIENPTPENSVLVYGWSTEPYVYLYYCDTKSDWETIQKVGGAFVLPPAYKGANLEIKASRYEQSSSSQAGNVIYHNSAMYEITNKEWNVNVPTDKALYYMGIHSIVEHNIYSWKTIEEMRSKPGYVMAGFPKTKEEYDDWYKKTNDNTERACLKKLLKQYKGTAWEPLIKERMDELSK